MHTSWWIFALWLCGIFLGIVAQSCNYLSSLTKRPGWCPSFLPSITRQHLRTCGFGLGVLATLIAGLTAFKAAIDWRILPMTEEGMEPGQLWDDGGVVAVIESDERRALWDRLQHQSR